MGRSGFVANYLTVELEKAGIPYKALGRPELDLTDPSSVEVLTELVRPTDAVVMLSALTPDKGRDFRTVMKNLRMAEHLAEVFDRRPCAHVVYVSSDAVYDGRHAPLDEESTREPADLYALMHTGREMMLQSVLTARQIPYCILRPVALFGPGDTHNSYGPNRFAREALEQRTITLFGGGEDERTHLYIDDAVRLVAACSRRNSTGVLNLASPDTLSFRAVAEMIRSACPFPVELTFKERPGAGTTSRRPFTARALHHAFPDFAFTPPPEAFNTFVKTLIGRGAGA